MQPNSFICVKHPQNSISFFCIANQWHFVPLCVECVPHHTQNHQKNIKICLQGEAKVKEKAAEQQTNAIEGYKKRLQKIVNLLSSQNKPEVYSILEQAKEKCHETINNYFESFTKQINQKIEHVLNYQKQLLKKLEINICADIKDLQNMEQIKQVQQWTDIVKRLFFKDGITPYLDEIDDILKDHSQRTNKKDIASINLNKIQQQIKKTLYGNIFLSKQKNEVAPQQKIQKIKGKDQKKASKIIIKAKQCKVCGQELQYLTQLKKHLFCPNCGGKQRNYTAKKV